MNYSKSLWIGYCMLLILTTFSLSAQVTENFEFISNNATSFTAGGLTFNLTGDFNRQNISGYGTNGSNGYLDVASTSGTVGTVPTGTASKMFRLISVVGAPTQTISIPIVDDQIQKLTVNFSIDDTRTIASSDYPVRIDDTVSVDPITFPSNNAAVNLIISQTADTTIESNETVVVKIDP